MAVKKNWLGSEVGIVTKTVTIPSFGSYSSYASTDLITEDGRKILLSGTLVTDSNLGSGFLVNDADITDAPRVAAIMIKGVYINANLPTPFSASAGASAMAELSANGLYNINYPATSVAYGEVSNG